jgi:tRNA-Thr(GGU) m(6)t(6)A37 methyltransferase TsaA
MSDSLATSIAMTPIGFVESRAQYRLEQPRQGTLNQASQNDVVRLLPHYNFEQALTDISLCPRIWLVYIFHENLSEQADSTAPWRGQWKPKVSPPRIQEDIHKKKIGIFATRSPYRPNPLGISCVKVLNVDSLCIHITESDLLHGTPILDIKPYVAYADSFPSIQPSWLPEHPVTPFTITFHETAKEQADWLHLHGGIDIANACMVQLSEAPTDTKRKRVRPSTENDGYWIFSYRTWRVLFHLETSTQTITVEKITSGYTTNEMLSTEDTYKDKNLHKNYIKIFFS